MLQDFRTVLCDGKSLVRVDPSSYGVPGPLTLHSFIGNRFINVSYMMLSKQPMRVCWMGDLANYPFDPDADAYAGALPEEEFLQYYDLAWENADVRFEIPRTKFSDVMLTKALELRTTDSYLVNHTRRAYLDLGVYIKNNLVRGKCLDPLPLLTACGNGRGDNEYPAEKKGAELIGTWAFSLLEYTRKRPAGSYREATVQFEQAAPPGSLAGKTIVVTGKVANYTRMEVEKLIIYAGGTMGTSVSRSTDLLVVAKSPGATKLNAAAKFGTKQITEAEFMDML